MKTLIQKLLIFSSFLLAIIIFADVATACSCIESRTVDQEFAASETVAVLKLQSVEKAMEDQEYYTVDGIKQSKLSVEKVFKGELKSGETLTFAQGSGADCIWTFSEDEIGTEFLFYLREKSAKDDLWYGSICSRSGKIKHTASDILYIEKEKEMRGKTRLFGGVVQSIKSATEDKKFNFKPLANKTIRIQGNGKDIKLKTDKNGIYEIYELPPGKYKVSTEKIEGYRFSNERNTFFEVEIKEKSHTEQGFYFDIDNAIGGRLFDANGKPLKDVRLSLLPLSGKKANYFFGYTRTDNDGNFRFEEIPKETYLIIINEDGKITPTEPFGTFYYPGVKDKASAARVTVDAGIFIENLVINAPETFESVVINGTLVFEDNEPVPNKTIEFFLEIEKSDDERPKAISEAKTDEKGQFSIKIIKGQKGKLLSSMYIYSGDYEDCPKLERFIQNRDEKYGSIETQNVNIEATENLSGIILKFPFSTCEKEKGK